MEPKLALFSPHKRMPNNDSPVHQTLASVPFQWEKEPGKPNTTNLPINKPKSLEPPPRLYSMNSPSPTTVLEGPYSINNNKISSSSFRFLKNVSTTPEPEQFVKKGKWWQRNVKPSVFLSSIDEGRSCSARMASFRRNGSSENLHATKSQMIWVSLVRFAPLFFFNIIVYFYRSLYISIVEKRGKFDPFSLIRWFLKKFIKGVNLAYFT